MEPYVEYVYLSEVVAQAEYALIASQGIETSTAIRQRESNPTSELGHQAQRDLFRNLHSFLTHTSALSRLFWPGPMRKRLFYRREGESFLRTGETHSMPQIGGSRGQPAASALRSP